MDAGILDQVTQQFLDAFKRDAEVIKQAAMHLFYYLVLIQLTISALWMGFAGSNLNQVIGKTSFSLFTFGLFYAAIQHGGEWVPQIINGFIQIGQHAGIQAIDPSAVIVQGINISGAIMKAFFNWGVLGHPFVSFLGGVICISIIIIYGLLAAELVIVIVKSYFLVSVASLFFAFSGSSLTRPMTVNYFKTVLGIGLQMMTLYFLIGVGQTIGQDWVQVTASAAKEHELMPMFVMLATVIVYYMIVKNIPSFIAGLAGVGGFHNQGDSAVSTVIGIGTQSSGQVMKSFRTGGKVIQAGGQATESLQSFSKSVKASQANGFPTKIIKASSQIVKDGASATTNTVSDMVMRRNQQLTFGQKFNKHLSNKVKG